MSRIGKKPVALPAGVEITVSDANMVTVKGPKGQLEQQIDPRITLKIEDNQIVFERPSDNRNDRSQHGLSRTLINNMVCKAGDALGERERIIFFLFCRTGLP